MTQTVVYRSLDPRRELPGVFLKCACLIGGVFVILGVAMGLANYLVDAEIPIFLILLAVVLTFTYAPFLLIGV
jgi:hypothetical protein